MALFLNNVEFGMVGFFSLGMMFQPLENFILRNFYHLEKNHTDVLIVGIRERAGTSCKQDDVIFVVDGFTVENKKKIYFSGGY